MSSTRAVAPPLGFGTAGISLAPGTNSDRIRSQSRFCPAGPEITSYTAAMIASMDFTSSDRAAGGFAFSCEPIVAASSSARTTFMTHLSEARRGRLSRRIEERGFHDLRRHEIPHRFDRRFELQRRAFGEMRGIYRRERNQFLQHGRPARRRRTADLSPVLVNGDGDARRGGSELWRKAHIVVQLLDRRPADLEADDLPWRAAPLLLDERLLADERPFVELHEASETHLERRIFL